MLHVHFSDKEGKRNLLRTQSMDSFLLSPREMKANSHSFWRLVPL